MQTLVRKVTSLTAPEDGDEFILSDASVDRYGDVIEPGGWDLSSFRKNPIALFGHDSTFPVGTWQNLRIESGALRGRLQLAAEGTSTRHDEIRKLVGAGILKAVSVGFRPLEISEERLPGGGLRYKRQELLETSLVSVPANPNALLVAKSLGVSNAILKEIFKQGQRATISERISNSRARAFAILEKCDRKYGKRPSSSPKKTSPRPSPKSALKPALKPAPKPAPDNTWRGHDLRVRWRGQLLPTFEWRGKGWRDDD